MFTLELIINPIVLLVAGVFGILIGYLLARGMLTRARSAITKLEAELLASYAETLEAQKAYIEMEARLQDRSIPVIPMNINGKEITNDKFGNEKFGADKFGTDKFGKDKSSKGKATR